MKLPPINEKLVVKQYWIYMLECEGNRLYTGYTNDIVKRYKNHLAGKSGAKFVRAFKPKKIAQCWEIFSTKGTALRIESFIKKLSKNQKERIVENPQTLILLLNKAQFEENLEIANCNLLQINEKIKN